MREKRNGEKGSDELLKETPEKLTMIKNKN